jgi:cytochrome c-type biogenesis protein CcmE
MKKVIHVLQGVILGAGLVMVGLFVSVKFLTVYLPNPGDIVLASLALPFLAVLFFTAKKRWWLAVGVCIGAALIVGIVMYAQAIAAACPNGICVSVAPSLNK